ncbi:hypothetical protein C8R43DRAFT_643626 [Mycena crocata]|nr:hypothetical protein C8R43DRAFT_643626 [Mycena crocata]
MNDVEKGPIESAADPPVEDDGLEASCAKIWSVYITEAEKYDKALVESWRGDMDGMLIFAGLFSASLTAFIIESYKTLIPDASESTAALLDRISQQLAASASGTVFNITPTPAFIVPATSVICNTLWFIGLGLSLACALIATLVEQWARDFVQKAEMRPSPVIRSRIFSYLYYGLKRFNMHILVDLVPLLLHMSLVLFFAGLVAFLLPVNHAVMIVAATLLGIVVAIYCTLTILPLIYSDCPYRTPFSTVLWRVGQIWSLTMVSLRARRFGPQQLVENAGQNTMLQVMISCATEPSTERDRRSLCWTLKSLVDDTELEPFIDGIPDVLWGPNGRRYKHDHLIRALLDDPEVRLGDRLLDFMQHSDSGLLTPEVELRQKITCLKAFWTIAMLFERDKPFNLPSVALMGPLLRWEQWSPPSTAPNDRNSNGELCRYLPAAKSIINWCILRTFEVHFQNVKSELQKCELDIAAGRFSSEGIRTALNRMVEYSRCISAELKRRPFYGNNIDLKLLDKETAEQISAGVPTSCERAAPWLTEIRTFLINSKNYWNDARHEIIHDFLRASIPSPHQPNTPYQFNSTLEIVRIQLAPPSNFWMENYGDLLNDLPVEERTSPSHDHIHRSAVPVLEVLLSFFFPLESTSRPHVPPEIVNNLISYFSPAHVSGGTLGMIDWYQSFDIAYFWTAMSEYLLSGCPRSNDAKATLEVMCRLYTHFWNRTMKGAGDLELIPPPFWFDESILSSLLSFPIPPSPSALAIFKDRILETLMYRRHHILDRLMEGEIMGYNPETYKTLLERTPIFLPEGIRMIPPLPQNFKNKAPTVIVWNEVKSILFHPLLSETGPSNGMMYDPTFDFEGCDDDIEKGIRFLRILLIALSCKFFDAQTILYAEFLEACCFQTLPYYALEVIRYRFIMQIRDLNLLLGQPDHRNRFANSIQALMKARYTTSEHTHIWEEFILESPILGRIFTNAESHFRSFHASGLDYTHCRYDQSAMLIIRSALEEYAVSIDLSSDTPLARRLLLEKKVQELLNNLNVLLELTAVADAPVVENVEQSEPADDVPCKATR